MMGDRRISRKRRGNVPSSFVTPAYMIALQTMALIEKQQEKVQFCEKQPGKNNHGSQESR